MGYNHPQESQGWTQKTHGSTRTWTGPPTLPCPLILSRGWWKFRIFGLFCVIARQVKEIFESCISFYHILPIISGAVDRNFGKNSKLSVWKMKSVHMHK